MQVAGRRAGVAGAADLAERLARPDALPALDGGPAAQVRIEVVALLLAPVDQHEPAVETGIEAAAQDAATAGGAQAGAAGGGDVEALVVRPPLRGAPNSPVAPRVPCGPRTGKT